MVYGQLGLFLLLNKNSPYGNNKTLVTNPSNVPYGTITYGQINHPGRQWIFEYALALSSELLGLIRGKYAQIPAPGSEVTLNGADLISKGQAQQIALKDFWLLMKRIFLVRSNFDHFRR